jgi:uncharacterized protein YecE (DUF72 family)
MESFVRRTSGSFSFVVKAYRGMTHERSEATKDQFKMFREGISPLGKSLRTLLIQFPFAFLPTRENIDYLGTIRDEFGDYDSVVEFRNSRWFEDNHMDVLRDLSFGNCIVDEPKLKGLLPFHPALTSKTGYFRFHGCNKAWFREPLEVRYDYLYSEQELKAFVDPIQDIARKAETTFVFFNNCHLGKAAKNAQTIKEMLGVQRHKNTIENQGMRPQGETA